MMMMMMMMMMIKTCISIIIIIIRVQIRKKKWWFPFYTWSLSVWAVNAWRLRNRMAGSSKPFLTFMRELVVSILTKYRTQPSHRRSADLPNVLREEIR